MRSILMAAAVATCCKWVLATPPYRVRRRPKARTPCESVPSTPARRLESCWPSSLADQVCAACSASYCSWGGSRSRRPVCLARVQLARTGHVPHVCLSNATMMGRLPCPPPCSHHATDRWPWGQRTCCWSQSTAHCSGAPQDDTLFVAAVDEECRADIRGIDQVFPRSDVLVDERLLDGRGALRFMDRGWGRVDVGEQVGRRRLTGFADMDHGAGPLGVAFVTVARVGIVRRCDPLGGRR